MSFLTEWYPEFIRDIKDEKTKKVVNQILSDTNKKRLMSLGINKNSKINEVSMEEAKRLGDKEELVLFRNKKPTTSNKIWIGYTFGPTKFMIYLPSVIGANDVAGPSGDKSKENRDKLYKAEQAFHVTIDERTRAIHKFKNLHPERLVKPSQESAVLKHFKDKFKNEIIDNLNDFEKIVDDYLNKLNIEKQVIDLQDLYYYAKAQKGKRYNAIRDNLNSMMKDYKETVDKDNTVDGIKKLIDKYKG